MASRRDARRDAGGAFHPAKSTLPTLANVEHPHGEVWYGKTVTYGCRNGFSVDGRAARARSLRVACGTDGQVHPSLAGNRSGSRMPSLATESTSTVRVLRTSNSMATVHSEWCLCPSQSCAPSSSKFLHYCVSDGGAAQFQRLFRRIPVTAGFFVPQPRKVYDASNLCFSTLTPRLVDREHADRHHRDRTDAAVRHPFSPMKNNTPTHCGSLASVHSHKPAYPSHVSASCSTPLHMLSFLAQVCKHRPCERVANS